MSRGGSLRGRGVRRVCSYCAGNHFDVDCPVRGHIVDIVLIDGGRYIVRCSCRQKIGHALGYHSATTALKVKAAHLRGDSVPGVRP